MMDDLIKRAADPSAWDLDFLHAVRDLSDEDRQKVSEAAGEHSDKLVRRLFNIEVMEQEVRFPPKLSAYEIKAPGWVVPGYILKAAINIICAAGGVGKTSTETALAAAITAGKMPFLCGIPEKFSKEWSEPGTVLFLSGEDFASYTIRQRVEAAGGNIDRVYIVDPSNPDLPKFKIGEGFLDKSVTAIKPKLIIIDPLQAFLQESVNMSSRNQMRAALTTIAELASRVGAGVLIAVHSNKRPGAWGRDRISDSSDIWDAARSVLMLDFTADGDRYISHEKCNWAPLSDTVIFRISGDGTPEFITRSTKRDRDFQLEVSNKREENRAAPKRESCEAFILDTLSAGDLEGRELQNLVINEGWSRSCFMDARTELYNNNRLRKYYRPKDGGRGTTCCWSIEGLS